MAKQVTFDDDGRRSDGHPRSSGCYTVAEEDAARDAYDAALLRSYCLGEPHAVAEVNRRAKVERAWSRKMAREAAAIDKRRASAAAAHEAELHQHDRF